MLEYLLRRRSAKAVDMIAPGPDKGQMKQMLSAAMRVPDHGKTAPFYFLVFEGEARDRVAAIIAEAYGRNNPDDKPKKAIEAGEKFMQAPTVVAVIYRARKAKHPLWEQIMSVGAGMRMMNMCVPVWGWTGVMSSPVLYIWERPRKSQRQSGTALIMMSLLPIGMGQAISKRVMMPMTAKNFLCLNWGLIFRADAVIFTKNGYC
jgi:hypothetical protein